MSEWSDFGKEILNLALRPKYSFALWVGTLLLLTAPMPSFLRLGDAPNRYGEILGIVCFFAFVVWAVEMSLLMGGFLTARLQAYRSQRDILGWVDTLNRNEATVLSNAIKRGSPTVTYNPSKDEVNSLVSKGLLEEIPCDGRMPNRPYVIPRFVWGHITKEKFANMVESKANQSSAQAKPEQPA